MAHQSKKRKAERANIDHFSQKQVIPERGIVGINDEDGGVLQYYNWGKLVEEREEVVIPVVREFYANASVSEDFSVKVRGMTMSYSIEAINQYYGLPDTEVDEYLTYLNDGFDENEVIQSIAKGGAQWLRTKDQASKLRYDDLKPFAKAWMKFINSNNMLSTHYNTVSKDRATPREDESAPSEHVDIPEPSQAAPDSQTAASAPPPSTSSPYAAIEGTLEGIKWQLRVDYDLMKSEVRGNVNHLRTKLGRG